MGHYGTITAIILSHHGFSLPQMAQCSGVGEFYLAYYLNLGEGAAFDSH